MTSNLMTEEQLAEYLQISTRTLQARRIRGGGIPYVKIGRAVRYKLEQVEAYIESRNIDKCSELTEIIEKQTQ